MRAQVSFHSSFTASRGRSVESRLERGSREAQELERVGASVLVCSGPLRPCDPQYRGALVYPKGDAVQTQQDSPRERGQVGTLHSSLEARDRIGWAPLPLPGPPTPQPGPGRPLAL